MRLKGMPMSEALRIINQKAISFGIQHQKDAEAGLGYCPKCDHEYTEAQVENIDHDRAPTPYISQCPNCHTEEERTLYWCNLDLGNYPLHHPDDCAKYHHD